MLLFLFSVLLQWLGPSVQCWIKVIWLCILSMLLILWQKHLIFIVSYVSYRIYVTFEETVLHESPVATYLASRYTKHCFVPDYLFKDICIAKSLGIYSVSLQSKGWICLLSNMIMSPFGANVRQGCLQPITRDLTSLNSVFLFCNVSYCVCRWHLGLIVSSCEIGAWESSTRKW